VDRVNPRGTATIKGGLCANKLEQDQQNQQRSVRSIKQNGRQVAASRKVEDLSDSESPDLPCGQVEESSDTLDSNR
jgi:uncharacterized sporulation protein YeaH/YhbH (DUF444 family)